MSARAIFFIILMFRIAELSASGDTLNIIFAGDVMQHTPQMRSARTTNGSYNYAECFKHIKNEISSADIAIANLELTLAGPPYSGYPRFSAPDEIAIALRDAGFNILVTANNHSCDRNGNGIKRTLDVLDSLNITHTGSFRNRKELETTYPLIIKKNNFKLAVLNYTYGTNGIPIPPPYVVNTIDPATIVADIKKAKKSNPDFIIAFMHWGTEYSRTPNEEQRKLADLMCANDVNIIIGSHPHVIQPIEKRYSPDGKCIKLIAYSLGNFMSNQSNQDTDGGMMLKVSLIKDNLCGIKIAKAQYGLVWMHKPVQEDRRAYHILPAAEYQDKTAFMSIDENQKLNKFIDSSRKLLNKGNIGVCEFVF